MSFGGFPFAGMQGGGMGSFGDGHAKFINFIAFY